MNTQNLEQELEKELHVSRYIIVYKFVLGLVELLLGLGIVFFGNEILRLYQQFKIRELLEDPHDLLIMIIEKLLPLFLAHRVFIILLLILLGVTKVAGSIGLYFHKHWGLDLLIGVTLLLLPFDTYTFLAGPTIAKFIYFAVNIFIALYLVNFKPRDYFVKLKSRVKRKS